MLVLLDRDGVINVDAHTGITRPEDFHFLPGAIAAIARLTQAGRSIAICTNQSAIGQGRMSEATLATIHANMCRAIEEGGGRIDAIYHAPDRPENPSHRRKPGPGMLHEALQQFGAEAAQTPFVGDMLRDLEAGFAAGCPRILVRTGKGASQEALGLPPELAPITVCDDLDAAVTHILRNYN